MDAAVRDISWYIYGVKMWELVFFLSFFSSKIMKDLVKW